MHFLSEGQSIKRKCALIEHIFYTYIQVERKMKLNEQLAFP